MFQCCGWRGVAYAGWLLLLCVRMFVLVVGVDRFDEVVRVWVEIAGMGLCILGSSL